MSKKIIIGFAGKKQSGKTTAAAELVKSGFIPLSFAAAIKDMVWILLLNCGYQTDEVAEIMRGDKEKVIGGLGKSPREILQTLGTEWGRELIHPDLWVIAMRCKIERMNNGGWLVFDDVRFENEAAMIREFGGLIVHVDRYKDGDEQDLHSSEAGITDQDGDQFIDNDGSMDDFLLDVQAVVEQWTGI